MMLIIKLILFSFICSIKLNINENPSYVKHIAFNPNTKIITTNSNGVTYDLNERKNKMIIDTMINKQEGNTINFGNTNIDNNNKFVLPSITPLPLDTQHFNLNANSKIKKENQSKNIKDINMISKSINQNTDIESLNEFNKTLSTILNEIAIDSNKLSSQLNSEISRCKSLLQMLSIPNEISNVSEKEKALALSELEYQLISTINGENVDKSKTSHVGIIAQDDIARIVDEVRNELSAKELNYY